MRTAIGIDLGGTKTEGVVLREDGAEVLRRRRPTPRGSYEAIVDAVVALVAELEAEAGDGALPVGVGHPGAASPRTGLLKNANSQELNGRPFARDLAMRLGRAVLCANDADCFALSEAVDGAAVGARSVFGVICGTGVGGGIVVDGRILQGPNATAGEWGHVPLPWMTEDDLPPIPCWCGRAGCIERYLSGPGLAQDHRRWTGEEDSPEAIVAAAHGGDPEAQATLERYEARLARGLALIVNVLDPEVIVLGGGLSNIGGLVEGVEARWARFVFGGEVDTRLVRNRHGDSSGVRGAAWLALRGGG